MPSLRDFGTRRRGRFPRSKQENPPSSYWMLVHRAFGETPEVNDTFRLYSDLAWLWPMWGDATVEYAQYCGHIAHLIRRYARRPVGTLLDIGCGGGKNVLNLKAHFRVTGLDLSPTMIAQARTLNPDCTFIEGDMRSFAIGRTFDAILMDDAVSYMISRADLSAAFRTACNHLNPGGVLIATPDVTTESFRQNQTTATPASGKSGPDHIEVVFIENSYDPNPSDDHYEATMLFLIRENGTLRIETDRHTLGLFSLDTWRRILSETGFEVHEGKYADGLNEYTVFACTTPA
jgi:SAM-dependent methyltransferase